MAPITLGILSASSLRVPDFIDYLVVAGGGGGGQNGNQNSAAGGGGAGGYRTSVGTSGRNSSPESVFVPTALSYTVTVGAGGAGVPSGYGDSTQGFSSVFASITSIGGGFGQWKNNEAGGNGGSGGGGGHFFSATPPGGLGTANQGFDAANGAGGGGAGAGSTGSSPHLPGDGIESSITGTAVKRAGGGRGSPDVYYSQPKTVWGGGGTNYQDQNGTANTGSGGGAGNGGPNSGSGNGGSGVVILRYASKFTKLTVGAGLTYNYTDNGTYKIYTFTAGTGNISWE